MGKSVIKNNYQPSLNIKHIEYGQKAADSGGNGSVTFSNPQGTQVPLIIASGYENYKAARIVTVLSPTATGFSFYIDNTQTGVPGGISWVAIWFYE